jgi:endogenous inhibitor of DNA gyrase (YacG/DUF329 family)
MNRSSSPPACAVCGKPQAQAYRPFCSRRCADVDLQRWLSGGYVVPGAVDEAQDGPPRPRAEDDED